jgi:predicted outer membrane lipoprotein
MGYHGNRLTPDELATLDYVTGITPTLPEPDGPPCEDRWLADELSDQRLAVQALVIETPPMRLRFDDVAAAAEGRRPVNRIRTFWSLGLMMAVAFLTGILAALWIDRHQPDQPAEASRTLPSQSDTPLPKSLPATHPMLPY